MVWWLVGLRVMFVLIDLVLLAWLLLLACDSVGFGWGAVCWLFGWKLSGWLVVWLL